MAVILVVFFIVLLYLLIVIATYKRELEEAEQKALSQAEAVIKARIKQERKDAINRSYATLKGKLAETLAPLKFEFNPRDCRFLGSPVDYIVFDGLSDGEVEGIYFIEIKTGRSRLSQRERQVVQAVEEGCVFYETFRPDRTESDS